MNRKQALAEIWRTTPRDYKGSIAGVRTVMVLRGSTTLVALDDLTDAEIKRAVPDYKIT